MSFIRIMTLNDWNQLQKLEINAFPNDPLDHEGFLRFLSNDGFFGLFDEKKNLIGYLFCKIYGDYPHLHRIGILETERGKGYGSQLFEKAISYFEERNAPHFNLFVETKNSPAIALYKKFDLSIIFESWHFIIDLNQHSTYVKDIFSDITSRELTLEDMTLVQESFPQANLDELKGMLEDVKKHPNTNHFIVMFQDGKLNALARFNKKFSGCRPFFIADVKYFDTFLSLLIKAKDPEKSYIRITFDDNDALAKMCIERNYEIHHHLYKMTRLHKLK